MAEHHDVYFQPNLIDPAKIGAIRARHGRGDESEVGVVIGVFGDVDAEKAGSNKHYPPRSVLDAALAKMPMPPSIVVNSGLPDRGVHAYTLFAEPVVIASEEQRASMKGLSEGWKRLLCKKIGDYDLDSTFELNRVLRPPGTVNHKYGCLVTSAVFEPGRRYDWRDFEQYIPDEPDREVPKKAKAAPGPVSFDPGFHYELIEMASQAANGAKFRALWAGDAALIGFVQRLAGYCLTGDVSEQILPIVHGVGANGKSTLLNVALDMLGEDYSMKAPPDFLVMKRALKGKGLEWGGLWADEAVSAFKRPLLRRANGRAMIQMLCVFAEWESRVKSERVKAAMVILRQQGRHTGGKPPWGYKVVGPRSNPEKGIKGNRRLEPDWEERALMLEIVRLRDLERIVCWETIPARMRQMQARSSPGGPRQPRTFPPGVVLGKLPAGPRGLLDRAGEEGRDKLDRRSAPQETGGCPTRRSTITGRSTGRSPKARSPED